MASRTRFIDNPGVSAFGTSNFPTSASHADRADIADSVRQENLIFSGSFSGSFEGNGEGLTDIPATSIVGLNLSQISSGSYSASIAPAGTFKTNADATIDGDLTVTKDFKVFGSASFTHASNLTVSDKYILLASGSAGATDGGIVVEQAANGKGVLLAYDAAASRWGLTSSFDANTSAGYTPDAYIVNTLNGLSTTSDIPSIYNKEGNIFIDSLNDSWIYSNKWNKIIVSEGNQQITGSLEISGSTTSNIILPDAPTNAVIISGSNDRTRLHIYESVLNSSPIYTEGAGIKLVGGTAVGNQATLELSAVGSSNGGGSNEQTFIHSNQQLVIQAADDDAGKNIQFRGSSYGLDFTAGTAGVTLEYVTNGGATVSELNMGNGTYIQADANGTYYKIGRSSTDWLNLSSTKATFAADVSSSITSTASFGTYLGDGAQLTGIETDPFPYTGDVQITGSLEASIGTGKFRITNAVEGIDFINVDGNQGRIQIDKDNNGGIVQFNTDTNLGGAVTSFGAEVGMNQWLKVGIGNDTPSNLMLDVNGSTNISGSLRVSGSNSSIKVGSDLIILSGSTGNQFKIDNGNGAPDTYGITADASGNTMNLSVNSQGTMARMFATHANSRLGQFELNNWTSGIHGVYFNGYYTDNVLNATYQRNFIGGALQINKGSGNAAPDTTTYALDVAGPVLINGSNSNSHVGLHISSSGGSGSLKLEGDAEIPSGNLSGSATSTASFGTYLGDGSQLTGIVPPFGKFGIANASGAYTYYSDLSSSLQASTAGDTIQLFTNVTEASDHTFHLKDKVDFNFNGNELFISASATLDAADMITDNDVAVSCSFYNGRIRFTQGTGANIFNRLLYIDNVASEITSIGFEWEVENGTNATPYHPIRNDGTLNGGKFIGGSDLYSYLIETYGVLKNLNVYAKKGISFKGYLKKHYNLKVHTYGGQAGVEGTNSYIYDSYFHAETGQALSVFYAINCTIIADAGAGISGTRRLVNSTIRNAGGVGVTLNGEMIGGSVYTENDVSIAAASFEVLGVTIYNKEYLGPGITLGNGEISNCAIIDDYATNGQNSIQITTGATSPTITNCSFDFYNNTPLNTAITAVDDDTPVFFANNTFKNCTPTNPTKVTQAVLNTPDAQGNITINN